MANQGVVLTKSNTSIANLNTAVGVLSITNGGTGLNSLGAANQILGVNAGGTALEYKTLVAGANVTIIYAPGQITIASSGGGGGSLYLYAENPVTPTTASATGNNAIALGSGSVSRVEYGVVQAGGFFATAGDALIGKYTLRAITTDNTPAVMYIDGVSTNLTLVNNSTWTFDIRVTGHRTDADDTHAGFEFSGVIYRQVGAVNTFLQGAVSKTVIARSNGSLNCAVTADTVNGGITITVTGNLAKTIRWLAVVETTEVTN